MLADGHGAVALPGLGHEFTQMRLSRSQRIRQVLTVTSRTDHCGQQRRQRTCGHGEARRTFLIPQPATQSGAALARPDRVVSPRAADSSRTSPTSARNCESPSACTAPSHATTGDLLNVAKALWSGWRHNLRVIAGHTVSFRRSCPSECPSRADCSPVHCSESISDLGGAKRARTADLLHAMNHQHVHGRHHTLRQLRRHQLTRAEPDSG
jgi:hypothetical protein